MGKKNDGGPAFPIKGNNAVRSSWDGMSLRDYFAAHALTGLIAQCDPPAKGNLSRDDFAVWSYEMADAMLKEKERNDAS